LACLITFAVYGAVPALAGQWVWGPTALTVCAVLGLVFGIIRTLLDAPGPKDKLIRALFVELIRGLMQGILLFLVGLGSWNLADLVSGGKMTVEGRAALGAGLGLATALIALWFGRPSRRKWLRWTRRVILLLLALFVAVLLYLYLTRTGAEDPSHYPPREQSPYRLPWPPGITWLCSQGNWGVITHRKGDEFAYDFAMPIGSDVCAARAGLVIRIVDINDGNGFNKPGNYLTIRHDDGTFADYVHIKQGGSYVRVGQRVRRGQRIAASGNVGYSTAPHLHFEVRDRNWKVVPVTFVDVESHAGIPRMFLRYTSGNSEEAP
jgi:Peptidase family M23